MKCIKCGNKEFIIESTVAMTEEYKIFKNGKVAKNPRNSCIANEDVGSHDTLVKCGSCNQEYWLGSRHYTLEKVDYKEKVFTEDDLYMRVTIN